MPATAAHKELASHFRSRLRASGIAARCSMQEFCGEQAISVSPTTPDATFTAEEQTTICTIAEANHLSASQGMAIVDNGTKGHGAKFFLGYGQ